MQGVRHKAKLIKNIIIKGSKKNMNLINISLG